MNPLYFQRKYENTPEHIQAFSEWLDSVNDSLPEPASFSEWLKQNDDAILEERKTQYES